jgi:hypothetical protein
MLEQTYSNFTAIAGCARHGVACIWVASVDAWNVASIKLNQNDAQGTLKLSQLQTGIDLATWPISEI